MERKKHYSREELVNFITKAKKRIRVLGAVSFSLPYDDLVYHWYEMINKGKLQVEIICESESALNYSALISSNKKVSGEERSYNIGNLMTLKNAPEQKVRDFLVSRSCKYIEPEGDSKEKQLFSLRTSYLPIPLPIINIDDDYYLTQSLTMFCLHDKFEKIEDSNIWLNEYQKYFNAYFDSPDGAKKYSTEITRKDNRTEVILMYNDKRQVLGQLPRDSFLRSTKVKVVVWGMLFTRNGKVLIHKRKENAKDNRDMWDKSIGGHVDLEKDTVDTTRAAAREMLEELYKLEAADQGGHSSSDKMTINEEKPIFLGDWRPEIRYTVPLSEVNRKKEETFFFRLKYDFSKTVVDSPRHLPDGKELPVKVFADVYVFIMAENFKINELKNSQYKLLELHELNDCYLDKVIEEFDENNNSKTVEFKATPDLKKIITGDLWTSLNEFADYLHEGINNK